MEKLQVLYDDRKYFLYVLNDDGRTKIINRMKRTQEDKINAFRKIVRNNSDFVIFDLGINYGEFVVNILDINDNDNDYNFLIYDYNFLIAN